MQLHVNFKDGGGTTFNEVSHAGFEGEFFRVYDECGRPEKFIHKDEIAKVSFYYLDIDDDEEEGEEEDDDEGEEKLIGDNFIDWLKDNEK